MQFKLTYAEIQKLIQDKAGKELPMCYGGPHTINISYKVPLMGSVGLDINIDRINCSDIFLSYGGGAGIEFMVRQALNQARKQPGMELVEILDGPRILLSLGKSANLAPIFERILLQDIHFDEQSVMIDFIPR